MKTKDSIKNIAALQSALAATQAANDPISRIKASTRLIKILKDMGLYDDVAVKGGDIDDGYSDDMNAENYRYADTGYIAGSHKEMAAKRIKELSKDGQTVKTTDIEWDEIEADPLFAENVIKKSNIMGEIDYQAMKDGGGDAGTALMIQKVFASIAPTPHWDILYFLKNTVNGKKFLRMFDLGEKAHVLEAIESVPAAERQKLARKAYVTGINTLKDRIINQTDTRSLVNELKDIGAEMFGTNISAADTQEYEERSKMLDKHITFMQERSKKFQDEYAAAESEAEKRLVLAAPTKRKGVIIPIYKDGEFTAQSVKGSYYTRYQSMMAWLKDQHPKMAFSTHKGSRLAKVVTVQSLMKYSELRSNLLKLTTSSRLAAFKDPNTNLAWIALGERFWAIVELSSGAFVKHANMALNNKYDDWGLVIKEANTGKDGKAGKKTKSTFELIVADKLERVGGKPVDVKSTEELKDAFGFKDIQSGTWILKDKAIAKFHVESAAAAMMDLSDVVGIDAKALGFDGRLALAIGARGRKGAKAHYEPSARVINISKMKGGGSLGHEWFHAIDNILGEVLNIDGATSAGTFLSKDSSILGDHPLNAAFTKLRAAMTEGDVGMPETFTIDETTVKHALLNITESTNSGLQAIIKNNDAAEAIIKIDERLGSRSKGKRSKNHNTWRRLAAAYHNQDKIGQTVTLATGRKVSSFYAESALIDEKRSKPYWSSTLEMAARSFQAFLEDSLKDQGRKNDYLSYGANNDLYRNHKAYPAGEERKKINLVFAELFKVIKDEKVFENAMADEAMMDAIFGPRDFSDNEPLAIDEIFSGDDFL